MADLDLTACAPEACGRPGDEHGEPEGGPPPLRFDRRGCDRWPERGVAVAFVSAGARFGQRYAMRLVDASAEGIGAQCDRALEPGTVVTIGFAAPAWPLRSGTVLRCTPCGDGYRLAIRFERRAAA
jgi:RNase P subunit RPR2